MCDIAEASYQKCSQWIVKETNFLYSTFHPTKSSFKREAIVITNAY